MYKGKTKLNPTKTISSNRGQVLRKDCYAPSMAGGRAETVYSSGAVGMAIRAGRPAYRTGRPGQCEAHRTCLPDRQVALTLLIHTSMPHIPSRTFGFWLLFGQAKSNIKSAGTFTSCQLPMGTTEGLYIELTNAFNAASVNNLFAGTSSNDEPAAYLQYLFFDADSIFQQAGFVGVSITAYNNWEKLEIDGGFTAPMDGFLYVYVANESASDKEVFFDDIKILHESSVATFKVSQINDYYPPDSYRDGMLTGNSWRNDAYIDPGMLYQGAYARYDSLTGYYDFLSRSYDPALGRFFAVDPAGQFMSPYVGMGNMPMMGVDEDGEFFWVAVGIGALLGGYSGAKIADAKGAKGWDKFFNILGGAIIGGGSAAAGLGTAQALTAAGQTTVGFGAVVAGGALGGSLSGGAFAGMSGQDVGRGFWMGGVSGAIGGAFGTMFKDTHNAFSNALFGGFEGSLGAGTFAAITGQDVGQAMKDGLIWGSAIGFGGTVVNNYFDNRRLISGDPLPIAGEYHKGGYESAKKVIEKRADERNPSQNQAIEYLEHKGAHVRIDDGKQLQLRDKRGYTEVKIGRFWRLVTSAARTDTEYYYERYGTKNNISRSYSYSKQMSFFLRRTSTAFTINVHYEIYMPDFGWKVNSVQN
jgi:RHS repeat-associated protein